MDTGIANCQCGANDVSQQHSICSCGCFVSTGICDRQCVCDRPNPAVQCYLEIVCILQSVFCNMHTVCGTCAGFQHTGINYTWSGSMMPFPMLSAEYTSDMAFQPIRNVRMWNIRMPTLRNVFVASGASCQILSVPSNPFIVQQQKD